MGPSTLGSWVCWRKKGPVSCSSQDFRGTRGQVTGTSARGGQTWVTVLALPFITWQHPQTQAAQGLNRSEKGELIQNAKPQLSLQHSQMPAEVAQATQAAAITADQRVGRGIWKRSLGMGISVRPRAVSPKFTGWCLRGPQVFCRKQRNWAKLGSRCLESCSHNNYCSQHLN